jgi:hypothetical protein
MHTSQQYHAALELLAQGAVIEETRPAPQAFCLRLAKQRVPFPASLVQQLLGQGRIQLRCRVSGLNTYTGT